MIKRWVQQAGLSFFTPAQTAKPEETVARLDERAERVTSVLQHILEDQGVGQETRSNE